MCKCIEIKQVKSVKVYLGGRKSEKCTKLDEWRKVWKLIR